MTEKLSDIWGAKEDKPEVDVSHYDPFGAMTARQIFDAGQRTGKQEIINMIERFFTSKYGQLIGDDEAIEQMGISQLEYDQLMLGTAVDEWELDRLSVVFKRFERWRKAVMEQYGDEA